MGCLMFDADRVLLFHYEAVESVGGRYELVMKGRDIMPRRMQLKGLVVRHEDEETLEKPLHVGNLIDLVTVHIYWL